MQITIGKKLIFGYLIVVLLMTVLALYAVRVSQRSLEESVGKNSVFLAGEMLKRIDRDLRAIFEDIKIYTLGFLVNNTISRSNQAFENMEDVQEYIKQKDAEWVAAPKEEITPFMQQLINNELSHQLRQEFIQFWERQRGRTHFTEVFVTNKYGANAAQTGKTSDYYQADEEWWQISRREGFYMGHVEYDERARAFAIPFTVRLDDEQGNFIGTIKAVVSIMSIIREAEIATRMYETTDIKLICQQHKKLIYATGAFKLLEDVSGKEFFKKITEEEGFFIAEEGKKKKLFSYAQLKGFGRLEGLEWILVVGHDVQEILKPAFVLRNSLMAASLVLIALGIIVAFFMSRSITKPIAELAKGVEIIGKGDLEHRFEIKTRDEIGGLANTFNKMMADLKNVTASRDELNKEIGERKQAEEALRERTYNLGERVKELNCLYGVSKLVVESDRPLDEVFQGAVNLIPPSWQYPVITCGRIVFEGQEFRTDNFIETEWKQSADILISGEKAGAVEMYYLEEKPEADEGPFLKEERDVIDTLGRQLGAIAQRKQAEEELKKHRANLEETVRERTTELQKMVNLMAGREVRMAELKETIKKLRAQVESAGMTPMADDPLKEIDKK